jgi:hypothetical protein
MFEWEVVQPYSIVGKLSKKVLNRLLSPKLTATIKQRDTAVDHIVISRIARLGLGTLFKDYVLVVDILAEFTGWALELAEPHQEKGNHLNFA